MPDCTNHSLGSEKNFLGLGNPLVICIWQIAAIYTCSTRCTWACMCLVFLKLLWFVRQYVCVCLCVAPRALITRSMICCDIEHVWLVKHVLPIFPAFSCFIWYLLLIKWIISMVLLTQHVVNSCQRRLSWCGTSNRRTTQKTERFS